MFKSILKNRKSLAKQFSKVQLDDIKDDAMRSKFKKLNGKQGGFTLLELLVVVAILAAIAGTASIALQDTDARASAAAHVAMMDELNKGVRTFRVLNKNTLPTNFDSLIQTTATDGTTGAARLSVTAIGDVALIDIQADAAEILNGGGVDSLRYVLNAAASDPEGAGDCSNIKNLITSRNNAVVAGNIFLSPKANGCGYSTAIEDQDAATDGFQYTAAAKIAVWTGGFERIMGQAGQGFDTTTVTTDGSVFTAGDTGAPVLMAVGLGPSSNLFNANQLGGMTTVPVYRHVSEAEYNRFIGLFNVGTLTSATTWAALDQVTLAAIVDGAGDTKEEELGEWDGTRNTI